MHQSPSLPGYGIPSIRASCATVFPCRSASFPIPIRVHPSLCGLANDLNFGLPSPLAGSESESELCPDFSDTTSDGWKKAIARRTGQTYECMNECTIVRLYNCMDVRMQGREPKPVCIPYKLQIQASALPAHTHGQFLAPDLELLLASSHRRRPSPTFSESCVHLPSDRPPALSAPAPRSPLGSPFTPCLSVRSQLSSSSAVVARGGH